MNDTLDGLQLTRKLVSFDTINPPGRERPCVEYIAGLLEEAGFQTTYNELGDERASLVARLPATAGDRKPIVYSGHIDTVPLGLASWSVSPFDGEVHDGRLYGRGTSDMKSGVAAFILAARRLAERRQRRADVVVMVSAGEETGCDGVLHLAKDEGAMGECGALIVAEPTDNRPMIGHKGALWMDLVFSGVTAHGSMPDKGDNAIYKACTAIEALRGFDFGVEADPVMGGPTLNVGTMSAGMNVNSVPDSARIGVDIRTTVGQTNAGVRETLFELLGRRVEFETLTDMDHVYTDPEDPWIRSVFETTERVLGAAVEVETATYFSDASVLKPAWGGPPTVIMGPGTMAMAHQTDEYCEIDRIDACVDVFTAIGEDYLS